MPDLFLICLFTENKKIENKSGTFFRGPAGQGLAHIPTDLVRSYLQNGRMITLLDEYEFHYPALHFYYPRENKRHELLRAFVEFLRPISST